MSWTVLVDRFARHGGGCVNVTVKMSVSRNPARSFLHVFGQSQKKSNTQTEVTNYNYIHVGGLIKHFDWVVTNPKVPTVQVIVNLFLNLLSST